MSHASLCLYLPLFVSVSAFLYGHSVTLCLSVSLYLLRTLCHSASVYMFPCLLIVSRPIPLPLSLSFLLLASAFHYLCFFVPVSFLFTAPLFLLICLPSLIHILGLSFFWPRSLSLSLRFVLLSCFSHSLSLNCSSGPYCRLYFRTIARAV